MKKPMKNEVHKNEMVYQKIKESIIKNELTPGHLLVERQLCEEYNVSRTPIREALQKLETEGFVEVQGKSVLVATIRYEDMIEIFELREALETKAINLFVQRKTDAMLKDLEECFITQEKSFKEGNYELSMEKDMEFHSIYVKGSQNKRLETFLNSIMDQITRMALHVTNDKELIEDAIEQHRKVLNAVKENDAKLAEELVKSHIEKVKEYHVSKYYLLK